METKRNARPALPEREAARVYAELREMGYTWHQAHETMQRIAAEREACREIVEECIRTQAHLASNAREALSEASARIYKRWRA